MVDYKEMENIQQKVRQKIEEIISQQRGGMKREQIMAQLEGFNVFYAITSLVAEIEKEKQDLIEQLQDENRRLKAKVNQLSFCNDSERDKKVIELYQKGLPKTEIAKQTGLSRPGLYKTLRRLGVNGLHE
jgi:DNA invertase Pin-like site-specific DNA recombinase